jgi:hypothetical protein
MINTGKIGTQNNFYLKIAEFGYDHSDGFTEEELKEYLRKYFEWNEYKEKIIRDTLMDAVRNGAESHNRDDGINPSRDTMFVFMGARDVDGINTSIFTLTYDAFFNYVDYLEFQEAIKSSETAKKHALWAIAISAFLALTSICIQIYNPISLDSHQFNRLIRHIDHSQW